MKRAQMEIMGLAIIVILVSLGLLLVVRFVLMDESTYNPSKEYRQSELGSDFLNTLVETNVPECSNARFADLFQDCANNQPDGNIACYDGFGNIDSYSCEFIKLKTRNIMAKTFDEWKIGYNLTLALDVDNPGNIESALFSIGHGCNGEYKVSSQPFSGERNIFLVLYVCD